LHRITASALPNRSPQEANISACSKADKCVFIAKLAAGINLKGRYLKSARQKAVSHQGTAFLLRHNFYLQILLLTLLEAGSCFCRADTLLLGHFLGNKPVASRRATAPHSTLPLPGPQICVN
jgi:hypothetical protein